MPRRKEPLTPVGKLVITDIKKAARGDEARGDDVKAVVAAIQSCGATRALPEDKRAEALVQPAPFRRVCSCRRPAVVGWKALQTRRYGFGLFC